MRVNRITAAAVTVSLAGSLALGAASVAGAAPATSTDPADHSPDRGIGVERPREAPSDVTAASATARMAQQIGAVRSAMKPINHMTGVLTSISGLKDKKLAPEQAERYRTQMDRAVKPLLSARAASDRTRTAPDGTRVTFDGARAARATGDDLTAKAAADLRDRVNALLNAAVHGTSEQRSTAANRALSGGSNLLAATLYSGRLAAPDLKGLPKVAAEQAPQAPKKQQAPKQEQAPQEGQAPQQGLAPQEGQAGQASAAPVTPEQGR